MGMTERRASKLRAQRERILERAQELFRAEGYERVAMQDIADAAELSKGSLYLQFGNKEEILVALIQDSFARLGALLERESGGTDPAVQRLERLARAYLRYAREEGNQQDNLWLLARLSPGPDSPYQALLREGIERLGGFAARIIEEGQAAGSIRPELEARRVVPLFSFVMSLLVERLSKIQGLVEPLVSTSEEALAAECLELFAYYLRPGAAAAPGRPPIALLRTLPRPAYQ